MSDDIAADMLEQEAAAAAHRDWRRSLDDDCASRAGAVCRCGAGASTKHPDRCAAGHVLTGNDLALVVGHRSAAFWREHAEAQREIRDAIIADAGYELYDAPRALELAADGAAQAALVRDSAFTRMVQQGGPLTVKGKTRHAFTIWCAALDRTERHLRLVGLRREPRPAQTLAEVMDDE